MSNSDDICNFKIPNLRRFVDGECVLLDDEYNNTPISFSFNGEINHQLPVAIQITANETAAGKTFTVKWDKNSLKKHEIKATLWDGYSPVNNVQYLEYPKITKTENETIIELTVVPDENDHAEK